MGSRLMDSPFLDGEVLKYKVKWGFIRLGTVTVFQQKDKDAWPAAFQVKLLARSAKVPFISVFSDITGKLLPQILTNKHYISISGKESKNISVYRTNPEKHILSMESREDGQLVRQKDVLHTGDYYDPLGVIMMLRCLAKTESKVVIPTLVDFSVQNMELSFPDKFKWLKVKAARKPVKARRFEGRAQWISKGSSGMSGPFSGWISNDIASIPLKVKVKISLGSISLELEDMYRPNCDWGKNESRLSQPRVEGGSK